MKKILVFAIVMVLLIALCSPAIAETYDAAVTTDSGTYSVPVEVEDGEVTTVYWPNGGDMSVSGAYLDGYTADGSNSRGDSVQIEIDDYSYDAGEE